MVQYPHADVEHGFRVMFIKLILRFALSEFTTLYQFDVPVGVNLCFQAEGLDFERSESKTTVYTACCIWLKIFSKCCIPNKGTYRLVLRKRWGYLCAALMQSTDFST